MLLSWLTKGVVLNWQSSTTTAIDLLLDCLNNEALATSAASGFDIIVRNIEDAFTKESFSTIKLMYKQRYTQYVLPLLIQRYYDGVDDVKSYHMIAISNTLHAIPKQLLQKHLKAVSICFLFLLLVLCLMRMLLRSASAYTCIVCGVRVGVRACVRMHVYVCLCVCARVCACVYVCICVRARVCGVYARTVQCLLVCDVISCHYLTG